MSPRDTPFLQLRKRQWLRHNLTQRDMARDSTLRSSMVEPDLDTRGRLHCSRKAQTLQKGLKASATTSCQCCEPGLLVARCQISRCWRKRKSFCILWSQWSSIYCFLLRCMKDWSKSALRSLPAQLFSCNSRPSLLRNGTLSKPSYIGLFKRSIARTLFRARPKTRCCNMFSMLCLTFARSTRQHRPASMLKIPSLIALTTWLSKRLRITISWQSILLELRGIRSLSDGTQDISVR